MTQPKIHQTMVEPSPEAAVAIAGWRRPTHAYVLLEMPQRNVIKDGVYTYTKGLVTLNAESRAQIQHQVEYYIRNKGAKVIDYGNFPKLTSTDPQRAEKARLYSEGAGKEPWGPLETFLRQKMHDSLQFQAQHAQLKNENDALKAKLAEYEARQNRKQPSEAVK